MSCEDRYSAIPAVLRCRSVAVFDLAVKEDRAEERLANDYLFSQNFAPPSVFVDPRRAMLDARVSF